MATLYSPFDFVVKLTGHKLAHNHYSKSQRAAFAASTILGEVDLTKPTHKQVAKVFDVCIPYIQKALALSPLERAEMRDGNLEMTDLPPPKAELERVIGRAGTDPSWDALCAHMDALNKRNGIEVVEINAVDELD
jgi:hypothetical protein